MTGEGISVSNAGLVILNTYFKMLFERLNLVEQNQFISKEAQYKAVYCLQYIATGLEETNEHDLVLNKLLCGLDLSSIVPGHQKISDDEKTLIEGMIEAAISYWTAIGTTSVNGFRGNWLVRDGVLGEGEDRWELIVEKRSYDILMQRSPFSFSIIKMPWMQKPLSVTWNF